MLLRENQQAVIFSNGFTMNIKLDLHVHTHYSGCSNLRPDQIEPLALENGLNTVAICDHNYLEDGISYRYGPVNPVDHRRPRRTR